MIILNTLSDVQKLKDSVTIDDCITSYLEKYFITLSKQIYTRKPPNNFSLEKYGCIVFLQNAVDCKNLSAVGLQNEYKNTYPEYVERVELQGNNRMIELFSACIVINNEVCIMVFSQKGTLDFETEQFLMKESK